jgi:hypothetical protein
MIYTVSGIEYVRRRCHEAGRNWFKVRIHVCKTQAVPMDISINAKVSCSDGPCGRSTQVIVRPTTEQITHLVVSDESLPEIEYLVSIDHVVESTPTRIRLNCSLKELEAMPVFDKVEFVPSILPGPSGTPYLMWPYYPPATSPITLEKDHIPAD